MARAHRLSGYDPDEDEDEFEELQEKLANNEEMVKWFYLKISWNWFHVPNFFSLLQNWFDRAKLGIEKLVERVGFFGILACASVSTC